MIRLFDEHLVRKCISLDGTWRFLADPENLGEQVQWFRALPQGQNVIVPSVWNTQMGYLSYEGAAWYEKKFYTAGGTLRFVFEAVMTQADIWLDGVKLGSHYGGFCQFALIATGVEPGMHTLTVRADNSFDGQSVPMTHVDWWHYGGIPRSVSVEELHGVCVLSNHFDYTLAGDLKTATCHFTAELYNAGAEATTMPVSFLFDGETVFVDEITLAPYETQQCMTPDFTIDNVRLWSVEDPQLYEIAVLTDTDDLFDRTGLRVIEVKGTQIFLNHKPLEIRGINRHEENTDFGFAFPPALMQRDIACINRYDGWYYGSRDTWQEKSLATTKNRMQELGVPPKPVVVSEFGAAAIYGHHTFDDLKWTEEYQANMMEAALQTFHDDPQVAGWYIWQFCDIRTSPQNGLNRARHYNNKGLLNEYRRPKQAYFTVKKLCKAFAES